MTTRERRTASQRRAAFGKLLGLRVRRRELTVQDAETIIDDFAQAMGESERMVASVRRMTRRAYARARSG